MSSRITLAENLKKLRSATPSLSAPKQMVAAGISSNGSIGRVCNGTVNTGIDVLDQIANAYGLEPWQLLVTTLTASPGKSTKPIIRGVPEWPFELFSAADFSLLDEKQVEEFENSIAGAIQRIKLKQANN